MKATRKLIQIGLALLLLAMVIGPAKFDTQARAIKAQAQLVQLATAQPEQIVNVIVQKAGPASGLEQTVARLGGTITQDLSIIHSFAAKLSASAAVQLAGLPEVRWVSVDAPIESTVCAKCISTTNLANAYNYAIQANKVWNTSPYIQGNGIGVAVVDSGVNPNEDLYTVMGVNRQVGDVRFNTDYNQTVYDGYGHGTHVASIIGGDGSSSNGKYIGVAPMVNIINVKVNNDDGSATTASIVAGLQWILQNKSTYNIRVVNLSLNSTVIGILQNQSAGRRRRNLVVQRDRSRGFCGEWGQQYSLPASQRPICDHCRCNR